MELGLYLPEQIGTPNFKTIKGFGGNVCRVYIDTKEYMLCVQGAKNMWANTKKGFYGNGILNTGKDPYRTERVGLLGQMALAKLINLPIDFTYIHGGDDYDFIHNNKTTDIKTANRPHGHLLQLCMTERGKKIEVDKDYYVASYLFEEDPTEDRHAIIDIIAYATKQDVLNAPVKKGWHPNARHFNYELPWSDMKPIEEFLGFFKKEEETNHV